MTAVPGAGPPQSRPRLPPSYLHVSVAHEPTRHDPQWERFHA
ncbi:hypothetical protein RKD33_003020 [Streptomyces sp. SAI-129]